MKKYMENWMYLPPFLHQYDAGKDWIAFSIDGDGKVILHRAKRLEQRMTKMGMKLTKLKVINGKAVAIFTRREKQ